MANACCARLNDRRCCRNSQPNRSAPALAYDKFAAASDANDERPATDVADFIVLIIGHTARDRRPTNGLVSSSSVVCASPLESNDCDDRIGRNVAALRNVEALHRQKMPECPSTVSKH